MNRMADVFLSERSITLSVSFAGGKMITMKINGQRLCSGILELGQIGFRKGQGTSRPAYSEAFFAGRDWVSRKMEQAGLKTAVDAVGNLTGRLPGSSGRIIAVGSHIDTVPNGGMYDGAYGVLAGIEAVQTLRENGYTPRDTIEIIAFNEEEGNVVGGTFGSKAFAGQPQEAEALERAASLGIRPEGIRASRRDGRDYRCYLELHIEQGGILEREQTPAGIVDGIVGIARYQVTVTGEANHAGSTPMDLRDDALRHACRLIERMAVISGETDREMTCTVGTISVEPGAVNVVPGRAEFPIELRSLHMDHIERAISRFRAEAVRPGVTVERFLSQDPTAMDPALGRVLEDACRSCGLPFRHMPSGAGHDAINMALMTPTAMLFIPSVGGMSHNIREYSRPADLAAGAQVLLEALTALENQ